MKTAEIAQLDILIAEGNRLKQQTGYDSYGERRYWLPENLTSEARKWMFLIQSTITRIAPQGSFFETKLNSISKVKVGDGSGVAYHIIEEHSALIEALKIELEAGHLSKWQYNIAAEAFDEFLDFATHFHKGNKKIEAAIIASAVLEDTLKKIAIKSNIATDGAIEEIVTRLVQKGIINEIKKKRIQGYASLRNAAFHAEWEKVEIKEVGILITGVRDLIDEHLSK